MPYATFGDGGARYQPEMDAAILCLRLCIAIVEEYRRVGDFE
jgi:hypothetical protein